MNPVRTKVGWLFGVHYTAVSQERRRLRVLVETDRGVGGLLDACEEEISRIEKWPQTPPLSDSPILLILGVT